MHAFKHFCAGDNFFSQNQWLFFRATRFLCIPPPLALFQWINNFNFHTLPFLFRSAGQTQLGLPTIHFRCRILPRQQRLLQSWVQRRQRCFSPKTPLCLFSVHDLHFQANLRACNEELRRHVEDLQQELHYMQQTMTRLDSAKVRRRKFAEALLRTKVFAVLAVVTLHCGKFAATRK